MKLFQIEEPDGSPGDVDAPGVAVGIDLGGASAQVAVAVGGNAVMLSDRDGSALDLKVPPQSAGAEVWRTLFEGVRLRAERALGRPVTHAVIAVSAAPAPAFREILREAAAASGVALLRVEVPASGGEPAAIAAAIVAEDLAPRPEGS